jgi:hypothetical protein
MRHRAIAVSVKKKVRKALNIVVKRRGQGSCDPHPSD